MRSGATSERSRAESAISCAMSASGRFQWPATRARATCTARPGGARRLNCGSVMLLTEGMIMPMRAGAACSMPFRRGRSAVAVASMVLSPGWRGMRIINGNPMGNPFETERLWAGAPRRGEAHYFMRALPESFASVGQAMGFVSSCLVSGCLGKQGLAHRPFMGLAARGTCHAHFVLADAQQRADLALDTAVDCASGFRADKDEVFHSIQLFDCRLRAQAKA